VPVQLTFGRRRWKTSVLGLEPGNRLHRLLDDKLAPFDLPPEGLILTDYLGRRLGLGPGDMVTVEVLEGRRPVRNVPVAGLVRQMVGVAGYMDLAALNRMMGEGPVISGAYLAADADQRPRLYRTLHERPRVAGIEVQAEAIKSFMETMSRQTLIFTAIITILASIIAFGVVYNSARIALAERNRELASLRVLGFTRAEIAYILVGELALITLAALGPGMLMGRFLCAYMVAGFENELFRVPLIIAPWTYSFAAAVVIGSALFSALVLKRKLDRLDLVEALKTRE
jgi:putative ABC transport system permease protein